MAEYIDRDAAIAACFDGFADCRDDCAANIRSIPAADVRPVARGKWRKIGKNSCIFVCSACDETFPYKTRFCPNCGAYMREES